MKTQNKKMDTKPVFNETHIRALVNTLITPEVFIRYKSPHYEAAMQMVETIGVGQMYNIIVDPPRLRLDIHTSQLIKAATNLLENNIIEILWILNSEHSRSFPTYSDVIAFIESLDQ